MIHDVAARGAAATGQSATGFRSCFLHPGERSSNLRHITHPGVSRFLSFHGTPTFFSAVGVT